MQKTDIEYLTHVWNFYTGCKNSKIVCPIADKCWARNNYHRFGKDFEPQLHPDKLLEPLRGKTGGRRIGVCFTGDLFGDWVEQKQDVGGAIPNPIPIGTSLKEVIYDVVDNCSEHQFFFLTKNPQNYAKWGEFPDNAWLGATVCDYPMMANATSDLQDISAKHKWLSIEPLMADVEHVDMDIYLHDAGIEWLVIGGWSNKADYKKHPVKIEWIEEIVKAADIAGIPVFLKDNLKTLYLGEILRQELPKPEVC